jgi:hypothetical protein
MSVDRDAVKRFALTLLASVVVVSMIGVVFAALTGRATWHAIAQSGTRRFVPSSGLPDE